MANRSAEREQFLKDIVVGFTEDGGYNAWRRVKPGTYDPAQGRVVIFDIEEDGVEHEVTIETVAHGLAKLKENSFALNRGLKIAILGAAEVNDAGEIDCELADIIVQAGIFEEVVYG